jgi:hypothetical protein
LNRFVIFLTRGEVYVNVAHFGPFWLKMGI